jgi:hypothetical protein
MHQRVAKLEFLAIACGLGFTNLNVRCDVFRFLKRSLVLQAYPAASSTHPNESIFMQKVLCPTTYNNNFLYI